MTTDILAFLDRHFVALLVAVGVLLVLVVLLFRELVIHYQRTVKALTRLVQFITGLRKAAKGDATADDDLAQTISQPMKAQPDPRTSGEKKP